jgi:arginase family enzyme
MRLDYEYFSIYCFTAGTPEAGGWTIREVKRIIRGLAGLKFV